MWGFLSASAGFLWRVILPVTFRVAAGAVEHRSRRCSMDTPINLMISYLIFPPVFPARRWDPLCWV
ncbi:hypothetical protein BN1221_00111c [Brenneria goodwinii]|uniref:Uncharacterized protein n=1 Tax=Brenneria goodwinii TaxID=1109412 RepID=A0A0G4JP88_9GAMM|nr:hypothetical protein BN1221_00111c [Brenneria goodwinii]